MATHFELGIAVRRALAVALVPVVAAANAAGAQDRRPNPFDALRTDSTAWQRVLAYVVEQLGPQLVRQAAAGRTQPWTLELPATEPQRQLLESQLRWLLHARSPVAEDSVVYALKLGPLRVDGDTARVDVAAEERRACPGAERHTGSGWATTVLVPRQPQQGFWGAARARGITAGDDVGCPRTASPTVK